jgi:Ca-activated chloride channel family protein
MASATHHTPNRPRESPRILLIVPITVLLIVTAMIAVPAQDKKAGQTKGDQNDAVRLHSDLVVVTVTVTDSSGGYAHGLTARNFSIREDGAAQTIDSFSAEEAPFAAAILVDMSGSMEYKFGMVRGAAASFIESIRDNDQVALYGFNNKIKLFQDFTNSHYITDYIWDAEARDSTRLYDCLDEALEALAKRAEKRRAVLIISDGWDSSSGKTLDSTMRKAHTAGVIVYTVDLTDDNMLIGNSQDVAGLRRGRHEMQESASQTGGRYVHSQDGDKLEETFTNIVEELRNQYTLTYYSTNDKHDGRFRKLAVTVSRPDLTARTRRGYFAPKS